MKQIIKLSQYEKELLEELMWEHADCTECDIELQLSPSSIGTALTVHCPECERSHDITDYERW